MADPIAFEADSVTMVYRQSSSRVTCALDQLSLRVPTGTCIAVTGPSGSGKSTLMLLLASLLHPTAGAVRIAGRNLSQCSAWELSRLRRRLGIVFQQFSLIPRLSVIDNIDYPLVARGVAYRRRRKAARKWLSQLGLEGRERARPEELSGGEKQRVAIARALAGKPDFVLADEPTSNLDQESSRCVQQLLLSVCQRGGTVLLASHDPNLTAIASRVVRLKEGKIVDDQDAL